MHNPNLTQLETVEEAEEVPEGPDPEAETREEETDLQALLQEPATPQEDLDPTPPLRTPEAGPRAATQEAIPVEEFPTPALKLVLKLDPSALPVRREVSSLDP
jgi:hypothetical protein